MSVLDDLELDLGPILTTFSKSEVTLSEARQKKNLYSVTLDTYESLDYPVVRHIFYGRSEAEALGYLEAHKKTDKFLKACQQGNFEGMVCKNTVPVITKVPLASIKASGKPKPSQLKKDAVKGELAKKLGL